jgi:preprotein translocase SecE subunit
VASLFKIYKPGQGKWTRGLTAVGSGIIAVLIAKFTYDQLQGVGVKADSPLRFWLQMLIPAAMLIGAGWLILWAVNAPGPCEFLIATESELKKVNWSSKKELIGSTKVVVFVVLLLAGFLFCVDLFFTWVFSLMGVLPFTVGGA